MGGTLRLFRQGALLDRTPKDKIILDGQVVSSIANGQASSMPIDVGSHTLRLETRWLGSPTRAFVMNEGEIVQFICRPRSDPVLWIPFLLASLMFRHDWWIILERLKY